MLIIWNKRQEQFFKRLIAIATVAVFTFLALVSLGSSVHMGMDETGMMADCPFMIYEDTLCQMTIAEHIEHWQALVTGVIQYRDWLVAFFVLFFLRRSLVGLWTRQKWRQILPARFYFQPPWHFYLVPAFADGILHPKIYQRLTV